MENHIHCHRACPTVPGLEDTGLSPPPRAPCDWPLLSHSPNLVPQLLSLKAQQALTELKADGI